MKTANRRPLQAEHWEQAHANRGLAWKLVRQSLRRWPRLRLLGEPCDLVAELMPVLAKAARDFDPARGFRFSSIAWRYMTGQMQRIWNRTWRAKHRVPRPAGDWLHAEGCGVRDARAAEPWQLAGDLEERRRVGDMLERLPLAEQVLLHRIFWNGELIKHASQADGRAATTDYHRRDRALSQLRRLLLRSH